MPRTLVFVALLISFATAASGQQVDPSHVGKPAVFGSIGFGTFALDDFNAFIEARERMLQSFGIPLEWDVMRTGFEVGGAILWRANGFLGFGVEGGYQFKNQDARFSDTTGKLINLMAMRVADLGGVLELWVPSSNNIHVGFHLGKTFAVFKDDVAYTNSTYPNRNFDFIDEFRGSKVSGGTYVGFRAREGSAMQYFFKVGYRFRNLEALTSDRGMAVDQVGDPLEFDFSGFYARVGGGLSLF